MITILLIRGLSRQQGHWGDFPNILTSALNAKGLQVNLVFEDLPGFGNRNHQKSPSSIAKIAELLVPSLENLYHKSGKRVHILGVSMGGMVALELTRKFPEYCESLMMINSSVKPVSRFYQRLQPAALIAFLKACFHPIAYLSEKEILNISTALHKNDRILLSHWLALRKQQPPSRIAAFKQVLAASKFKAPNNAPIQNVLLIASKKDRIAHYTCSLQLAKLWGRSCLINEQAGHDIALDAPEWLAAQITTFLKS